MRGTNIDLFQRIIFGSSFNQCLKPVCEQFQLSIGVGAAGCHIAKLIPRSCAVADLYLCCAISKFNTDFSAPLYGCISNRAPVFTRIVSRNNTGDDFIDLHFGIAPLHTNRAAGNTTGHPV